MLFISYDAVNWQQSTARSEWPRATLAKQWQLLTDTGPHVFAAGKSLTKYSSTINIIIPTFNAMEHLPGCISSIRDTVAPLLNWRVFVTIQDGKSTDGTESFLQQLDIPGIKHVIEIDSGIYDAMNRAVAKSECDWVYFLGADDRLMEGFKRAVTRLDDSATIYYGDVKLASSGARYDGPFSPIKLVYRNICHQAIFFPTEILRRSPLENSYSTHADWAKNIELMAHHDYVYLDECIATFHDKQGSSANIRDDNFARDKAGMFKKHHGILLMILSMTAVVPTTIYRLAIGRHF